jgi:hypothetical protein
MSERNDFRDGDEVLGALDEVHSTLVGAEAVFPDVSEKLPLGRLGGLAVRQDGPNQLQPPSIRRWTGHIAKGADEKYIAGADKYLADLLSRERALFLGGELTEEQARYVSRIIEATADFAAGLGVNVSREIIPATPDYIRFYSRSEYAAIQQKFPELEQTAGFNSPFTHFIGIRASRNPSDNANYAQHEVLHRLGAKQYIFVPNENETTGMRCLRNGWGIGWTNDGRFSLLDETVIFSIADDMRETRWSAIPELAPLAAAPDPGLAKNAGLNKNTHDIGAIGRAFFNTMCARASDITGEDVRAELQTAHFSGDIAPLRLLSRAFGNPAVTQLSRYNVYGPSVEGIGITNLAEEMGIRDEFVKQMYAYKDMATLTQRVVRLFK